MHLGSIISALVVTGLALQAVLGVVLVLKHAWRKFPIFTAYCLFSLIEGVGLYMLLLSQAGRHSYRYGYAVGEGISLILEFGVVYEIFKSLFTQYSALKRMAGLFFQWGLLVLLVLGASVLYYHNSIDVTSITATTIVVQEATRIVEVGLLLFLFMFATAFGLHWRQNVFGVALGIGVYLAVELIGITMVGRFGKLAIHAFNLASTITFDLTLLVWIVYLLTPEIWAKPPEVPKLQLEQWNRALMEFIHQ